MPRAVLAITFYTFEVVGTNNYIIFLCYGNERVFHECAYALFSLSRLYTPAGLKDKEVWIYTDKPEWFRSFKDCPLPLNYRSINAATIKQWRGDIDFVHRVKIETLKDFTANRKGNLLYVDTDVVFTHRVEEIFEGIAAGKRYMHMLEGKVSAAGNPVLRKLNDHLGREKLALNGIPLQDMNMWNAGVLGFNSAHAHLLNDVLAFTDTQYPKFRKHVVEQFAFSAYFQATDDVKTAAPYIFHYWNLKEAGQVLASFFEYFKGKSWDELVQYSRLIQMGTLMQEKVVFLSNRGMLSRKKWAPAKQDWAELLKQL